MKRAAVLYAGAELLALADVGHVDHLVLLAGSFVAGKVLEADVTYLRRAFEERIWASVHVLRALGDKLASDASITFISGALADRPNAYGTAMLAAASAAMEAFARGRIIAQLWQMGRVVHPSFPGADKQQIRTARMISFPPDPSRTFASLFAHRRDREF